MRVEDIRMEHHQHGNGDGNPGCASEDALDVKRSISVRSAEAGCPQDRRDTGYQGTQWEKCQHQVYRHILLDFLRDIVPFEDIRSGVAHRLVTFTSCCNTCDVLEN